MANFGACHTSFEGRLPSLRKTGWIPAVHIDPSESIARGGRFALVASVALSVCVCALAAAALWHERESKLARVQRDLANLSHALAEHVARTLETIDLSLSAGLGQLRDAQGLSGAPELNQRALRAHADAVPAVSEIAFYGPDGARRASSTPDPGELPLALSASEVMAAQNTHRQQGLNISWRRMNAGNWRIIVSRNAAGADSEFRGVIAASIDSKRLAEPYKAINLGESGSVALYGEGGVLLASHPWREDMIGRAHPNVIPVRQPGVESGAMIHPTVSPFTDQPALAAHIPIQGYRLTVALTVDRSVVLAPWRREALFVGSAAVLIAALTLALGALVDRHLRRREESVKRLRENQAELTEAHRIAQLGRFSIDAATGTIQWSAQAAQLLGTPSALSSTIEQLLARVVEEDRDGLRTAWTLLLAGNSSDGDIEFRAVVEPGQLRWLRARAEVLPRRDRESIRARGTLIDITERKRVETAQKQFDERVRRITANIPGIVFEYRLRPDNTASFEYVSDRALDVLEESAEALMREPRLMFELVEPGHRRRMLRSMRASRENMTLWTIELPIRTRSGRVKWMRGQSVPKPLDDGSVSWDGVIIDVSAQKQAEQAIQTLNERLERRVAERTAELSAAYRELETFSYSVSHDLRAPLRSIDGFSRILLEDHRQGLGADAIELLGRVRGAARRMGQLIDDLMSLSRVTRTEIKRIRTDMSAIADAIVAEFKQEDHERVVDVRIERGIICFADPNLLRIALFNLLGNAWKFSSKRDRALIELGTLRNGDKTVYYVRDNGAGFDMKYAGKLFGAFQRVHSSREFDGTGIGLATVSRIIDRHGGAVWAQAEVNQGATFYFTLAGSEQR